MLPPFRHVRLSAASLLCCALRKAPAPRRLPSKRVCAPLLVLPACSRARRGWRCRVTSGTSCAQRPGSSRSSWRPPLEALTAGVAALLCRPEQRGQRKWLLRQLLVLGRRVAVRPAAVWQRRQGRGGCRLSSAPAGGQTSATSRAKHLLEFASTMKR